MWVWKKVFEYLLLLQLNPAFELWPLQSFEHGICGLMLCIFVGLKWGGPIVGMCIVVSLLVMVMV